MFAVMHSDINSLKSGLLLLTGQLMSRSAKVKDGIRNLNSLELSHWSVHWLLCSRELFRNWVLCRIDFFQFNSLFTKSVQITELKNLFNYQNQISISIQLFCIKSNQIVGQCKSSNFWNSKSLNLLKYQIDIVIFKYLLSIRLCHPPDGSTSPKYKLLCFITIKNILQGEERTSF